MKDLTKEQMADFASEGIKIAKQMIRSMEDKIDAESVLDKEGRIIAPEYDEVQYSVLCEDEEVQTFKEQMFQRVWFAKYEDILDAREDELKEEREREYERKEYFEERNRDFNLPEEAAINS